MGLRGTLDRVAKKVIDALGDVPELCSYVSVTGTSYNTATGAITKTSVNKNNVPIVFSSYNKREIDGEAIRPEDQKATVAYLHLLVSPSLNDTITRPDGTVWAVVGVRTDLPTAYYELQVRRP